MSNKSARRQQFSIWLTMGRLSARPTKGLRCARATASVRRCTWSLSKMRRLCPLTLSSAKDSRAPISWFDTPCAMSHSTSSSRSLSGSISGWARVTAGGSALRRPLERRAHGRPAGAGRLRRAVGHGLGVGEALSTGQLPGTPNAQGPAHRGHVQGVEREFSLCHIFRPQKSPPPSGRLRGLDYATEVNRSCSQVGRWL